MTPWQLLDTAHVPGQHGAASALRLYRRGEEFSIKAGNCELMNSRVHGSEDALAELGCGRIAGRARPRVLIGGLGMGYTLAAALRQLGADAEIVVAELVPAVVGWNRGALAHLAGQPLSDARVTVREQDVGEIMRAAARNFDAILLDVDNGPEGLTRKANDWLYGIEGLDAAYAALRPVRQRSSRNVYASSVSMSRRCGCARTRANKARDTRSGWLHVVRETLCRYRLPGPARLRNSLKNPSLRGA